MAYTKNDRGILFKVEQKKTPNHPDFQGDVTLDGVGYWISGWIKATVKGNAISIDFKKKEVKMKDILPEDDLPQ
jgi:hypothetical protein